MDIDRTIVELNLDDAVICDVLFECVAAQRGVSATEARAQVCQILDPAQVDPLPHFATLGITQSDYLAAVHNRIRDHITIYSDAVDLIHLLGDRGFRIYPATTNGPTAITAKLFAAGLADRRGVTCFTELFGGSTVCPQGKSGPAFFSAILQRLNLDPDDVIMIGDDPQHDFIDAIAAGIRQIVIVDRDQKASGLKPDPPAMRVRSLSEIIPMLKRRTV